MTDLRSALASVQTGPLIVAVIFGLTLFVVVMFVSIKSRRKLRTEIQRERSTRPAGQIGPAERRAKRTVVLGIAFAPVILVLAAVAAFSTRNHGSVPAWDSWLLFILLWGTAISLLTRFVIVRRRRQRSEHPS